MNSLEPSFVPLLNAMYNGADMRFKLWLACVSLLLAACAVTPEVARWFATPTPAASPTAVAPTRTPRPTGTPTATFTPSPTPKPTATPEPTDIPTPVPITLADFIGQGMTARQYGDYARALKAFQTVVEKSAATASPDAANLASEARFRLAEVYWLSDDQANAATALTNYLQATPAGTHAFEAHFLLAETYRARKDYPNALAQLRIVRQQTQALAGDMDARIADVLFQMGDTTNAMVQYDRALQDASLPTATRLDLLMRAGSVDLAAGQMAHAAARYDKALALAQEPLTRSEIYLFAGRGYAGANQLDLAIARWTSALTETPEQPYAPQALAELTNRNIPVDDYQRGLVDYSAGAYDTAIADFRRNLSSAAPRAGDSHYYIGKAYAALGAYSQAIAEYDGVVKMQPQDKRAPDALMAQAQAYNAIGQVDQSVQAYKSLASQFPDDPLADQALLQAGKTLEQLNRYREAAAVFEQMQAQYGTRETAPEALFRAGLDYDRLQDAPLASARWQSLVETYPQSPYLTSGLYWLGKTAMEQGQRDKAIALWTQAATLTERVKQPFRFSYYAWRAKQALEPPASPGDRRLYDLARYAMGNSADRAAFETWLASWTKAPLASPGNLDASIREDIHFRRGEEWLRLDRIADARAEFAELLDAHQDDVPGLYALALYFQDETLYSLAGSSAERIALLAQNAGAGRAPRFLQTLRYPTYYADLVVAESKANHIDPLIEFATIRLESRYDTWVTGPFGEKGLAQLEENTARVIAERLNMKDFSPDQLYRPVVNLHMSAWLIAQNSRQLDDPIYAFAAYNAGLPRALGWVGKDVDLAVEEFDIPLTTLYVQMAYGYWRQYLDLTAKP